MAVGVRIVLALVLLGLGILGMRLKAQYGLHDRIADFRAALADRGLASERGIDSVPSEDVLEERAIALAEEFGLEPVEVEARLEESTAPVGAARLVADRMGEVEGRRDVDADGNLVRAPTTRMRATVIEVRVVVHGEGFLVEVDDVVTVRRNAGVSMR